MLKRAALIGLFVCLSLVVWAETGWNQDGGAWKHSDGFSVKIPDPFKTTVDADSGNLLAEDGTCVISFWSLGKGAPETALKGVEKALVGELGAIQFSDLEVVKGPALQLGIREGHAGKQGELEVTLGYLTNGAKSATFFVLVPTSKSGDYSKAMQQVFGSAKFE